MRGSHLDYCRRTPDEEEAAADTCNLRCTTVMDNMRKFLRFDEIYVEVQVKTVDRKKRKKGEFHRRKFREPENQTLSWQAVEQSNDRSSSNNQLCSASKGPPNNGR